MEEYTVNFLADVDVTIKAESPEEERKKAVEMVDNDGIRKVCENMLDDIKAGNVSGDKFYIQKDDGSIIGIRVSDGDAEVEEFWNKADCFDWLISHA